LGMRGFQDWNRQFSLIKDLMEYPPAFSKRTLISLSTVSRGEDRLWLEYQWKIQFVRLNALLFPVDPILLLSTIPSLFLSQSSSSFWIHPIVVKLFLNSKRSHDQIKLGGSIFLIFIDEFWEPQSIFILPFSEHLNREEQVNSPTILPVTFIAFTALPLESLLFADHNRYL
jgi:hypothetical protein